VRQLLTESLSLALLAGAISWWVVHYLPEAMFALSADAPAEVSLDPDDVIRLLLGGIARPILAGVFAGLVFGVTIGALMRRAGLLIDVHPIDPISCLSACAIVGSAALVATLVPARRACRLHPWVTLRDN
jgi:hypothetical protein